MLSIFIYLLSIKQPNTYIYTKQCVLLNLFLLLVFIPLQTYLVNPSNIKPNATDGSDSSYFTDKDVLDNIPNLFLYMGAIFGVVFGIGCLLCQEAPTEEKKEKNEEKSTKQRLKDAWNFIYLEAGRTNNFYLLLFSRFLYLSVGAGVGAHWKTFSFTQSSNDQVSILTTITTLY